MWPGQRSLLEVAVSALVFSPLFLARPLLRAALVLLVVGGAAQLAYFFAVKSDLDEFFWITLFATHAQESWEYVQSYRWQDGLQLLAWLAGALYCAVLLWRRAPLVRSVWVRAPLALVCGVWLAWAGVSAAKSDSLAATVRKIDRIHPMRVLESYLHYASTAAQLHAVPQTVPPDSSPKADAIVVVIGESASALRWSLLDYGGADTNAALRPHVKNMGVFNVLANGNNTAQTVPVLLRGQTLDELPEQGFLTYLDQAKEAGFYVASLSNQSANGASESFFHVAFRQRSAFFTKAQDGQFDGALTPLLDDVLQRWTTQPQQQPLMVTLHTYGSHPRPAKRYPLESARSVDVYDNSIAYSSDLLGEWIERLQRLHDRRVVLLYISDHGLSFPECGGQYTHGYARSAYEVPMLVWANERFRQANSGWLEQVQANTHNAYDNRVFQATIANVLGYPAAYPSAASTAPAPERQLDGLPYAAMFHKNSCNKF